MKAKYDLARAFKFHISMSLTTRQWSSSQVIVVALTFLRRTKGLYEKCMNARSTIKIAYLLSLSIN